MTSSLLRRCAPKRVAMSSGAAPRAALAGTAGSAAVAAFLLASGVSLAAGQTTTEPPAQPAAPATIRWMEWSDEPFARAKAEGKPILLFVGARWSRATLWAEQVNFGDPEVVGLVNEQWVPIHVDRDRRPDIDLRYQVAVNAAFPRESGWPMTALLLEDGEMIIGSSHISLKDRRDRRGLATLLRSTADRHSTDREKAARTSAVVRMAFDRELTAEREPGYNLAHLEAITKDMIDELDPTYGGFGDESRLPMLYTLELAGTVYHRVRRPEMLDVLTRTLRGIEAGAIHDRVGGGFHRASTDTAWRVPEFEKLLSYNAGLVSDFLMGFEITGEEDFKAAAESALRFVLGTLKDPAGGFYVAQWAASSAEEPKGLYYAWGEEDFKAALPPGGEPLARLLFNVTAQGDLALGPPARSLLYLAMPRKDAAERLGLSPLEVRRVEADVLAALARARAKRQAPPVEKSIFVDSTSSAAVALLDAWRVLQRRDALEAALEAIDRLLAAIPAAGALAHRVQPPPEPGVDPALALDHMMLAWACLAGHQATGRQKYLTAARDLVDRAGPVFWDPEGTGYFDVASDPNAKGYLSIRRRLPNDTAYPSLNSLAARLLARLSALTGDPSYGARGETCLRQAMARTDELDYRMGGLGLALDAYLRQPTRYLVVGPEDDPRTAQIHSAVYRLFDPGKLIVPLRPGRDDEAIAKLKVRRSDESFAIACRDDRCTGPARNPDAVASLTSKLAEIRGGRAQR